MGRGGPKDRPATVDIDIDTDVDVLCFHAC